MVRGTLVKGGEKASLKDKRLEKSFVMGPVCPFSGHGPGRGKGGEEGGSIRAYSYPDVHMCVCVCVCVCACVGKITSHSPALFIGALVD